jgi:hypothetical protein
MSGGAAPPTAGRALSSFRAISVSPSARVTGGAPIARVSAFVLRHQAGVPGDVGASRVHDSPRLVQIEGGRDAGLESHARQLEDACWLAASPTPELQPLAVGRQGPGS